MARDTDGELDTLPMPTRPFEVDPPRRSGPPKASRWLFALGLMAALVAVLLALQRR